MARVGVRDEGCLGLSLGQGRALWASCQPGNPGTQPWCQPGWAFVSSAGDFPWAAPQGRVCEGNHHLPPHTSPFPFLSKAEPQVLSWNEPRSPERSPHTCTRETGTAPSWADLDECPLKQQHLGKKCSLHSRATSNIQKSRFPSIAGITAVFLLSFPTHSCTLNSDPLPRFTLPDEDDPSSRDVPVSAQGHSQLL